ncbi:SUMF1/EgtB/PvdO family nonheme iron enzyme [Odoribacter sp. OttesenSCG-928-J03]|nr:SUMF1/EgtB/PvdO family nonheme iron enzyme [Odoribacter sp. OttesenSCG-928-J03]MDL2282972.1 SUMF1/EgtB/PvdO family nonheme iron enzyme [Odoribacter sp. OttesenSCG-928-G04]
MRKLALNLLTHLLLALCVGVFFTSCNDDDSPATYAIAVTHGTGGSASSDKAISEKGETVTLTATADSGYIFREWVVTDGAVTLSPDAQTNPATFTMPAEAVSVKAEFYAPGEIFGITAVKIPAGTFMMGSPETELERDNDSEVQHQITLTKNFWMSTYEITNAQYALFLNEKGIGSDGQYMTKNDGMKTLINNPTYDINYKRWGVYYNVDKWEPVSGYENHPVIYVTWYGADEYCRWVGGSLPTEAQWEYAARGDKGTAPFGVGMGTLLDGNMANIKGQYIYNLDADGTTDLGTDKGVSLGKTVQVGSYSPNSYGLYDMHGNVEEWCSDWYNRDYYTESGVVSDPVSPVAGSTRLLRGGCFVDWAVSCRSANRFAKSPGGSNEYIGFRVVFVP